MRNIKNNPQFMILSADPKKYINTVSAAVLAFIRLLEGLAAFTLSYRLLHVLEGLFTGSTRGILSLFNILTPGGLSGMGGVAADAFGKATEAAREIVTELLPDEMQNLVTQSESQNAANLIMDMIPGAGKTVDISIFTEVGVFENLMCELLAIALLAALIATGVEGITLMLVRFTLKGSAIAGYARKVILVAVCVMLVATVCLSFIFVTKCRKAGVISMLFYGQLRMTVVIMILAIVLLVLRALYHKEVYAVFRAVHHEISTGFKEMQLEIKRLSGLALVFAFLCIAVAVITAIRSGDLIAAATCVCAALAMKYILVYSCWNDFRLGHM